MMNIFKKETLQRKSKHIVWIRFFLTFSVYREITCTQELRLLVMLSKTGVSYRNAGSCLTAIDMALQDINHREDIIKDYNLTYNWVDSKCDAGTALFRMFERLKDDRPYHLLLGPPCSVAAEATAQVSHFWNLTQLSCEASSPIFTDRTRFPRFFRTIMPDNKLNTARIALLKEFNWMKVASVHQTREFFSAVTDDLVKQIENTTISIIKQEIFAHDPISKVENLKRHNARIIIISMYEDKARELICAAYKIGLYGTKIVWMFVGWYSTKFWQNDLHKTNCTKKQMSLAVEGAFVIGSPYKNPIEERGIANITVSEFEHRYFSDPKYSPEWNDTDSKAALCYDHIWTAVLALDCAVRVLRENGHHKTLDQFTYADRDIGKILFDCMKDSSMIGVSGKTSFNGGPDTAEKIAEIERIQDGEREKVGIYRLDKNPSYFEWIEGAIRWKNDLIPTDSAQIENKEIELPFSLYAVMVSFGAVGICLSLSFLGINVIYRNNRNVKLSSPNINNMLLLGCVLCYMTVFFKTTSPENTAICRTRVYCFSLGFTITFGSLFSKTWRVYRIFMNKKLNRVQIKDSQLFAVNCLFVAPIVGLLIIWDTVGHKTIKSKFLPKEVYVTTDGTEIRPFVKVCWSEYSPYFGWTLYIAQGALLTFGTFLAWVTRHVHVKMLNDSQKIGMSLYNVVILSAVGVLLTFLLEDQDVLLYGISSGFLVFGTTVTQMLIFLPKVRAIINKVELEPISTLATNTRSTTIRKTFKVVEASSSSQQPNEKGNTYM